MGYGRKKRKASSKTSRTYPSAKPRYFKPGYDRTGGYYGRYNVPPGRTAPKPEYKFWDVQLDDIVVATAGSTTSSLNLIPQDTTESGRIGRKVTISAIGWHWKCQLPPVANAGAMPNGDTVRMMVVLDTQANGAIALVTDILDVANYQSFNNLSNSHRFRVLYDHVVSLSYMGVVADASNNFDSAQVNRNGTWYKRCHIPIEFSSTTGAIGEIKSNNLTILFISSNGEAGIVSKFRLRYTDS